MKQTSTKSTQLKDSVISHNMLADKNSIAVSPPSYGIDFVDNLSVRANQTGLPDKLKAGIEQLSGMSMDDVKVHYNSTKPAQLQALAYTQGHDIHVAPGQERHLPHEAWHVVQQGQGGVRPTMQMKEGVSVNDNKGLEHQADVMGAKAIQFKIGREAFRLPTSYSPANPSISSSVIQCTVSDDAKFITQARINQTKPKELSEMKFLSGKIAKRKGKDDYNRPWSLQLVGEAMIEYISENSDEPERSDPIFKYAPNKLSFGGKSAEMKEVVLGEVAAIMEFLEGRAQLGGGGGLFQSNPDKRWAMLSPALPTGQWTPIHDQFQSQSGWKSPVSIPVHGGSSQPKVTTPSGSDMEYYSTYQWDSPGGSAYRLHMYGQDVEGHQSPFLPSLQSIPPTKLGEFTGPTKIAKSQEIDLAFLNKWAGQRKGFRPDQNAAMANTSANDAALGSFGDDAKQYSWQWLHLIAFTLGGDIRDVNNPNTQDNLVAGLAAANGHHLVLENLVKKLILGGTYEKIQINATAKMISKSLHVAASIDYLIEGLPPGKKAYEKYANFHIDVLNPSKSTGGDLKLLSIVV